jgi:SAM-dependent methyltransferase
VSLADVQSRYDADAAAYIRWWAPVLRRTMRSVLDGVDWSSAATVVEIGCGAGGLLDDMAAKAPSAQVIGVDASYGMLTHASRAHHLLQGDAQRLPLRDQTADVIVSGFMLQHVPEPPVVFSEWARVLRAGGQLALAAWVGTEPWPAETIFTEELDRAGAPEVPNTRRGGDATDNTHKLLALAQTVGLAVTEVSVEPLRWTPTVDEVVGQLSAMRTTGRRMALLTPEQATAVQDRVRERLVSVEVYGHEVCHLRARRPV